MGQSQRSITVTHAILITALILGGVFSIMSVTSAVAAETFTKQSSAVRGITEMCAAAADAIARQPEAEKKILDIVREGLQKVVYKHDEEAEGVDAAIGIIRGAAIDGVARQPEAEKKLLGLVDECEGALKLLQGKRYRY